VRGVLAWFGLSWFLVAGCGAGGGGTKPEEYRISAEEQEIIALTNEVRAKENLTPLVIDPVLCKVARAHSARLAKIGRSSPLDAQVLEKGLQDSGYAFEIWGFAGSKFKEGRLGPAFAGVLKQKEASDQLSKPEFRDLGVGIAANAGKTEFFLTQVFAKKKSK
jgi:uncharacterized protein YkwD